MNLLIVPNNSSDSILDDSPNLVCKIGAVIYNGSIVIIIGYQYLSIGSFDLLAKTFGFFQFFSILI